MQKKLISVWIICSFIGILVGQIWVTLDSENTDASLLKFYAILSSLLAVGYYSTPSNSMYGKILFAFVVVTVIGIDFKILHYLWADEIIVAGLIGIFGTYAWMWVRERRIF